MIWFYRLQQRIAITRAECTAVLTLLLLFLGGLTVRYLQSQPQPLPEDVYAETDRLFLEGTAARPTSPLQAPQAAVSAGAADTLAVPALPEEPSPALRLDLNKATAAQLEQLPRIGPKTAAHIVAYRTSYGAFRRVDDLVQVRGIGQKTLARLRPYLFVEVPALAGHQEDGR